MVILFLSLIFLAIFLALVEDSLNEKKYYVYMIYCIVLILAAGFKPIGFDPDSEVYERNFVNNDSPLIEMLIEPSFLFISQILKYISDDVHILFLFYALISIPLKFYAIQRLMPWLFLPLVIYIGNFYLLHDFIQIRASVASGLFLLAIKPLSEGRKSRAALYFLLALVFHYSALMLFVTLFFSNKSLSKLWRIGLACVLPIGLFLYIAHINILYELPIPYIQDKMTNYQEIKDKGVFDDFNFFNVFAWLRIIIFVYALYFYDTIYQECKYLPLLLKIMGLSILSFFALSDIPIFSERVNEMFGVIEIFLFPYVVYTIKPAYAAKIAVCLIGFTAIVCRFFRYPTFNF